MRIATLLVAAPLVLMLGARTNAGRRGLQRAGS